MAGRCDNLCVETAHLDRVAFFHRNIDERHAILIAKGGGDFGSRYRFDRRNAVDMVAVMMGDQDVAERPARLFERSKDRFGFACVDRGGRARRFIMEKKAEIIFADEKLVNDRCHGINVPESGAESQSREGRLGMRSDVVDLRSFYGGPLGNLATRYIGQAVQQRWHDHRGAIMLGIGYATPYLDPFLPAADRVLALMPEGQGVVHWPPAGPSATALADTGMLPLPDSTADLVLLVHALETDDSPPDLLAEVWRVLSPGGRLIAVVPNRRGLWARMDSTPFGQGQPFSRGQLTRLMRESLFSPIYWTELLYMPPVRRRIFWRTASAWEKVGATLSLPFAGVHLIEATKLLYRPAPVRASRRAAIRFQPVLVPSTRNALRP